MTRKDYVLLAAALANAPMCVRYENATFEQGISAAARRVADALAQDNPRFDRERFLKAAGVPS